MKTKIVATGIVGIMMLLALGTVVNAQVTTELIAGKETPVGTVTVTDDGTYLIITFSLNEGWQLNETHVDVQDDPKDFPMTKKGNPKVGHFAYHNETHYLYPGTIEYKYVIPLSADIEVYYIAAHAVVSTLITDEDGNQYWLEETAWGKGEPFPWNNWAMYFRYQVGT